MLQHLDIAERFKLARSLTGSKDLSDFGFRIHQLGGLSAAAVAVSDGGIGASPTVAMAEVEQRQQQPMPQQQHAHLDDGRSECSEELVVDGCDDDDEPNANERTVCLGVKGGEGDGSVVSVQYIMPTRFSGITYRIRLCRQTCSSVPLI